MLLFFAANALAESAATFPAGAASVYTGLGVTSWRKLRIEDNPAETSVLYRDVTVRADLYGAVGVTDRLMLSLGLPFVWSRVMEDEALGPCPGGSFPCGDIVTLGTATLTARYQVHHRWLDLTPALAVSSSSWNAPTRGYYNTVGEATTDLGPALFAGDRYASGQHGLSWVSSVQYTFRTTFFEASGDAPHDDVRAALEVAGFAGPVTLTLGTSTYQRLGGIEVASLLGTEDRWAVADYDNASAQAKLSLALKSDLGLHLSATRVLWVRNGPPDAFDVSVGIHRWFSSR